LIDAFVGATVSAEALEGMGMIRRSKLSASASVWALLWVMGASPVQGADYEEPGCTISGAAGIGYMFDWQEVEFDGVGGIFENF